MSDTRRIRADSKCICGHTHFNHDTGWDAAGCMVGDCACRHFKHQPSETEMRQADMKAGLDRVAAEQAAGEEAK